jgi:NAD(P)-dependent dehydrogenase (short-subunit alcohol dehydrogenase family)
MANVLITGCSSGIGLATAVALGRAGHPVYATIREPDPVPALLDLVEKEKLAVSISVLDVDSDDSVQGAVGAIRAKAGFIDTLVNNAGIERRGSIEETPLAEFRAVMETNFFGSLRCIKACLPDMKQRRSGCIINVSSVAGRISCSPMTPYSASKYALEAVSEGLAQELKPHNIRVALVEPGIISTPMSERIANASVQSTYAHVRRFPRLFTAALATYRSPEIVAEKIREIIESGTWELRHPVGPDAQVFLDWRASVNDQQWVEWGAQDDEGWYASVQRDFGMDVRSKSNSAQG